MNITVNLTLTYAEALALNAMVKYGHERFLEGYYKQLGKSYLHPYESGVRSLFETVRKELPGKLDAITTTMNKISELKTIDKFTSSL